MHIRRVTGPLRKTIDGPLKVLSVGRGWGERGGWCV